jgi:hypothetical protein
MEHRDQQCADRPDALYLGTIRGGFGEPGSHDFVSSVPIPTQLAALDGSVGLRTDTQSGLLQSQDASNFRYVATLITCRQLYVFEDHSPVSSPKREVAIGMPRPGPGPQVAPTGRRLDKQIAAAHRLCGPLIRTVAGVLQIKMPPREAAFLHYFMSVGVISTPPLPRWAQAASISAPGCARRGSRRAGGGERGTGRR